MRSFFTVCFTIVGLLLLADGEALGSSKKKGRTALFEVRVKPSRAAPILDGVLGKNEWINSTVINRFTQKEPQEGAPVSEPTFILITYDHENIYFGIRCFDREPAKIVSNNMRRDSDLTDNDYVEIIIDSFHDRRNAYYFATNPLGARVDAEIKSEGTYINWGWDGVWFSEARKDEHGWTAEVAIPFKTIRFDNKEMLTWGINFGRYIPRKREEAYWSPITRDDDFDNYGKFKVSKFGTLYGIRNLTQGKRFQLKPYIIGGWERNFSFGGSTKQMGEIGLDAKIHLTSSIISDVTVNTDFAQVEADLEQVNLSRFDLFFPEKRDFFLEGLDIFNIREESASALSLLFHSRTIGLHRDPETFEVEQVPILGGVKITGKEGPYELGFLNVFTDDRNYTNLNQSVFGVPRTNYSAIRIKRDLFDRSYIGLMALSKDPTSGSHYNRTFAVDGLFSFAEHTTISGYLAKTETPGLDGRDYSGSADVSWGIDEVAASASYTDIGKNFNPEMGFIQWNDIRKYTGQVTLSPRPRFFNLKQMHFTSDFEVITNHDNELQYRTIGSSLTHTFRDESSLALSLTNYFDNVPDLGFYLESTFIPRGMYKHNIAIIGYESDYSRKLAGYLQVGAGTFYDGTFQGINLSGTLKPGDQFGMDLDWSWNRVNVPFGDGKFTTSIVGFRSYYSFTPNLFAKAYIQWNNFDDQVVTNFLVNFIHSPGSDIYLVYNETRRISGSFQGTDRTLIAKITYLLDF